MYSFVTASAKVIEERGRPRKSVAMQTEIRFFQILRPPFARMVQRMYARTDYEEWVHKIVNAPSQATIQI